MHRVALILFVALSGCTATPSAECADASCGGDLPVPAPQLPGLVLEGCRGVQATVPVPEGDARSRVGAAFVLHGDAPGTANLLLEALECGRVVTERSAHEDVSLLLASLRVWPANASWANASVSHFTLMVLASDERVAQAFGELGLPAESARREAEAAEALSPARRWTFRSAQAAHTLSWAEAEGTGQRLAFDRHLWAAPSPFHRVDVRETDAIGFPTPQAPGVVEAEGASALRALLGTDASPFTAQVLGESHWDIVASPSLFEETP